MVRVSKEVGWTKQENPREQLGVSNAGSQILLSCNF